MKAIKPSEPARAINRAIVIYSQRLVGCNSRLCRLGSRRWLLRGMQGPDLAPSIGWALFCPVKLSSPWPSPSTAVLVPVPPCPAGIWRRRGLPTTGTGLVRNRAKGILGQLATQVRGNGDGRPRASLSPPRARSSIQ